MQSGTSLKELRRQVTSPGGTTEEALKVFEQAGFRSIVELAVKQAFIRAGEIGSS
jgi:pyrroline-5-carboxylate reductase